MSLTRYELLGQPGQTIWRILNISGWWKSISKLWICLLFISEFFNKYILYINDIMIIVCSQYNIIYKYNMKYTKSYKNPIKTPRLKVKSHLLVLRSSILDIVIFTVYNIICCCNQPRIIIVLYFIITGVPVICIMTCLE